MGLKSEQTWAITPEKIRIKDSTGRLKYRANILTLCTLGCGVNEMSTFFKLLDMDVLSVTLIADLKERTQLCKAQAIAKKELPFDALKWRERPDSWSILECIEHLNRYGDFYTPEIEKRVSGGVKRKNEVFRSGMLGNYFANSMKPKEELKKMKTLGKMNPLGQKLDIGVIDRFIEHQEQMLSLLDRSSDLDLSATKTSISILPLLRLRLGDTLRFVVYHNQRHLIQAEQVLKAYEASTARSLRNG